MTQWESFIHHQNRWSDQAHKIGNQLINVGGILHVEIGFVLFIRISTKNPFIKIFNELFRMSYQTIKTNETTNKKKIRFENWNQSKTTTKISLVARFEVDVEVFKILLHVVVEICIFVVNAVLIFWFSKHLSNSWSVAFFRKNFSWSLFDFHVICEVTKNSIVEVQIEHCWKRSLSFVEVQLNRSKFQ